MAHATVVASASVIVPSPLHLHFPL